MASKDNTTKPELLPCPFCGGLPYIWHHEQQKQNKVTIRCNRCRANKSYGSNNQTVEQVESFISSEWNQRCEIK